MPRWSTVFPKHFTGCGNHPWDYALLADLPANNHITDQPHEGTRPVYHIRMFCFAMFRSCYNIGTFTHIPECFFAGTVVIQQPTWRTPISVRKDNRFSCKCLTHTPAFWICIRQNSVLAFTEHRHVGCWWLRLLVIVGDPPAIQSAPVLKRLYTMKEKCSHSDSIFVAGIMTTFNGANVEMFFTNDDILV